MTSLINCSQRLNMATILGICQVLLCITSSWARVVKDVTIATRYGTVVGERRQEHYDIGDGKITDSVDVFMGIPYALPPIGENRFKPPRPPSRWRSPLQARSPGSVCPQQTYYSQTVAAKQSEDCLFLNIYSPYQPAVETPYPVMVYIHGGSHEEGAGSRYDGFTLAQHGVVVVTINYRLGLLGFLTNGKSSLPGNYGFLDQIEALRWISENIGNFRGDSCSVTLFGSSAGSACIGLLMLSPHARGLFNRVILQSGSPLAFWATYNSTVDFAAFYHDVTDFMGCSHDDNEDATLGCMRNIHYSNFTDVYENFTRITPSLAIFKPRVDGDIITDRPRSLFLAGNYQNMSVMIGHVENEWNRNMGWFLEDLHGVDRNFSDGLERNSLERGVHHVIEDRFWWPKELADAVMFEYTDWSKNPHDAFDNRMSYATFMSDLTMVAPSVELVNTLTQFRTPVYHYHFNHSSVHTEHKWFGCYHTLELDYVFGSPFTGYNMAVDGRRNHTEDDKFVSRTVMALWTNFAKTGRPGALDITWTPVDPFLKDYLYISAPEVQTRYNFRPEKMAFWNVLVPQLLNIDNTGKSTEDTLERPTDMKLTLMWFFGILACLSFMVMLAFVVRNGSIQKKLTKALTRPPSLQAL